MHELSVCRALLQTVERIAAEQRAPAVTRVVVRVGPLSGVEPELLGQAFRQARAGTIAARAELAIECPPLRVRCDLCGAESAAEPGRLTCGACRDWRTRLVSGNELLLASIEFSAPSPEEKPCVTPAAAM